MKEQELNKDHLLPGQMMSADTSTFTHESGRMIALRDQEY